MDYTKSANVKNVFLTGATGVLGGRLLLEMLVATNAIVYCLVRASSLEEGKSRIAEMLAIYERDDELTCELWRVIPVLGDITEEHLGLNEVTYTELATNADIVFHCAASVNLVAAFEKLVNVNVNGTARLIDFCLHGSTPLVYASSFSVVGDQLFHERTFFEAELDVGQGFNELGYELSKFEAEKLVRAASSRGLVWTIVRPGNLWGDSESGCYPLFNTRVKGIYYEIVKSLVETGYTYKCNDDFDVTPVDYAAKATLHVGLHIHKTDEQTFHLTNPEPINYNTFVSRLRDVGYTVRALDEEEYFGALFEHRMLREGKPYRSTFTDLLGLLLDEIDLTELCKWDTSAIGALLRGTGISCPATDADLIRRYCVYAAAQNFINKPDEQEPLANIVDEMDATMSMQNTYDSDLNELGVAS